MKTKIVRKLLALMVLAATAMSTSGLVSACDKSREFLFSDYLGVGNFYGPQELPALLAELIGAREGAMEEENDGVGNFHRPEEL